MGMTSFIGFPKLDGVLGIPTLFLQQPLADGRSAADGRPQLNGKAFD
jgi:hypothetical protein